MNKITSTIKPHQNKDYCILELEIDCDGQKYYNSCCIFLKYVVENYNVRGTIEHIVNHYSQTLLSSFENSYMESDFDDLADKMKKLYDDNKVLAS